MYNCVVIVFEMFGKLVVLEELWFIVVVDNGLIDGIVD